MEAPARPPGLGPSSAAPGTVALPAGRPPSTAGLPAACARWEGRGRAGGVGQWVGGGCPAGLSAPRRGPSHTSSAHRTPARRARAVGACPCAPLDDHRFSKSCLRGTAATPPWTTGGGQVPCPAVQAAAGRVCAEDLPLPARQHQEGHHASPGGLHPRPPQRRGADLPPRPGVQPRRGGATRPLAPGYVTILFSKVLLFWGGGGLGQRKGLLDLQDRG